MSKCIYCGSHVDMERLKVIHGDVRHVATSDPAVFHVAHKQCHLDVQRQNVAEALRALFDKWGASATSDHFDAIIDTFIEHYKP